jgi:hypothetical protein
MKNERWVGGYQQGYGGYRGGGYAVGSNGSCSAWRRSCAQMYGRGYQWQECMGQPGAVAACGGY